MTFYSLNQFPILDPGFLGEGPDLSEQFIVSPDDVVFPKPLSIDHFFKDVQS
jgi:hypothetical protein